VSDERRLREIVERIVSIRDSDIAISPSWVATQAMFELDPKKTSESNIYLAAHLQFRQIARKVLGAKFEAEVDADKDQHPLFPDLQRRYPLPHLKDEEPRYKLLEYLDHDERVFNVNRLRKEASGKLAHADALEAYDQARRLPKHAG
jgi:hypothetical protein